MLWGNVQEETQENKVYTLPLKLVPSVFHGCVEFHYMDIPLFTLVDRYLGLQAVTIVSLPFSGQ